MICGATVFLSLWLHLDKIANLPKSFGNSIYLLPGSNVNKLAILHLVLFYYLSIVTADQAWLFHEQVGKLLIKLIFSDLTSSSQCINYIIKSLRQCLLCLPHVKDEYFWLNNTPTVQCYCFIGLALVGTSWRACSAIAF